MAHHLPVKSKRLFRPRKTYGKIPWKKFRVVVSEFKRRMNSWYFEPAKVVSAAPDAAFAEMALVCLLIDALSQYRYGALQSPSEISNGCNKPNEASGFKFKDFIAERIPSLGLPLPVPIRTGYLKGKTKIPETLLTYADVLYTGFRCGILHEAHVALYGAISGQNTITTFHAKGLTKYAADKSACPTVVIFPDLLRKALIKVFDSYLKELRNPNPQFDSLRLRFKEKFEDSFGVTIGITP